MFEQEPNRSGWGPYHKGEYMKQSSFSLNVSERGEATGETYNWSFTAKEILSVRDRIAKDNIRRNLLGDRPEGATPDTQVRAEIVAHLQVSLIDTTKEWRDLGNGLDILDENIIMTIYEKVLEGQNKAIDRAEKDAAEAKEKLRKTARSKKTDEQKDEGTSGGAA